MFLTERPSTINLAIKYEMFAKYSLQMYTNIMP